MGTSIREAYCHAVFRAWPFSFGHVHLMGWLNPPSVDVTQVISRLRRYPVHLNYDPNSYIGRFLHYRGLFEEKIIHTIQRELRQGATFIDVGANIGVHTIIAAHLVGSRGQVIAFEPGVEQRRRLNENIALNDFHHVEVHAYALGRRQYRARLYCHIYRNDGQSALVPPAWTGPSEEVEVKTLDSQLLGRPVPPECVMKIDVEGAELDVLVGAAQYIERVQPRAIFLEMIESHLQRFGASSPQVIHFLRERGYDLEGLVRGRWRAIRDDYPVNADIVARRRSIN